MPSDVASKRILVVDDDADILFAVATVLETAGYRVVTAGNGKEALSFLNSGTPVDLIILDMRMPIMDGWQFADKLGSRRGPRIPVIVMTAAADAGKRASEIDADGWIAKPFEIDLLIETVNRVLNPLSGA